MNKQDALLTLAQMAEQYINAQPPAVRAALMSLAQQSINALNEETPKE